MTRDISTRILAGLAALGVFVFVTLPAHADTRVALVIGNAGYQHVTALANPVNDAQALAVVLEKAHFAVTRASNLSRGEMMDALKRFEATAQSADVALIYFAGHGLEMDGENYLVPIDAVLAHDSDVKYEAVPLDLVRETVSGAHKLRLVLVDACRDNPFLATMALSAGKQRSLGERGLARIEETRPGEVVFFASKEKTTANDGDEAHSPFAAALIRDIPQPLELNLLLRTVADDVYAATSQQQLPYAYQSLSKEPFYFIPPSSTPTQPASVATAPAADPKAAELAFWNDASASNDPAQLQAYLDTYPTGTFAKLARAKLASLNKPTEQFQSFAYRRERNVGYVRLGTLVPGTEMQLRIAIQSLKQQIGPNLTGYVLDLRGNRDGLLRLDQAIAVADAFLNAGEIVSFRNGNPEDTQRYDAAPGDVSDGKPIVVLLDENIGTASKIVAVALQDHKRASLAASASLEWPSTTIDTAKGRYYSPTGRPIDGLTIAPDILITGLIRTSAADYELAYVLAVLEGHRS
jgi:hypothetical protein